jgi:uncharacterized protein (TIGR03083 family)
MSHGLDHLAAIGTESAHFAAALRHAEPSAPVPTCPDWTALDLLWHLTEVQLFWAEVVRGRLPEPDAAQAAVPARPESPEALFALNAQAVEALVDVLAATPDDTAVWTWADDQSVGFVRRRQAHEALIHRVDAELTAGRISAIEPALAEDGVDEVLRWMLSGAPEWAEVSAGPVLRLATVDTGREWLVRSAAFSGTSPNTGRVFDAEPTLELVAEGDAVATVRASAADLDLWLWSRAGVDVLHRSGDEAAFAALCAVVAGGIE